MNEEERESLWDQILIAYDSDDEYRVISLAKELSDAGDWRGSNTLGYVYELNAKRSSEWSESIDRKTYIEAAQWYSKAVAQGGGYAPHNGLATFYYYGLDGNYDFELAYEYLKYCIEEVPINQALSDKLIRSVAKNHIMMAELLFLGLGVPKNINTAWELFSSAVELGYPAALMGLSRIEKSKGRYVRAIYYYFRALFKAIKLILKDNEHPLLAGVGGKHSTFRLDWDKE